MQPTSREPGSTRYILLHATAKLKKGVLRSVSAEYTPEKGIVLGADSNLDDERKLFLGVGQKAAYLTHKNVTGDSVGGENARVNVELAVPYSNDDKSSLLAKFTVKYTF